MNDHKLITDISKGDKDDGNFLKGFSINFYQKIVDTNDFKTFESTLTEWIINIDVNKLIFESIQSHEQTNFWFSSIIGFFYQYGIGCDVDKKKALELYLLAVGNFNEKEFLEENDDEFDMLRNINTLIGSYLL